MTKNTICLWYERDAEEAARFYTNLFPESSLGGVQRAPSDYPDGKAGDALTVALAIGTRLASRTCTVILTLALAGVMPYSGVRSVIRNCLVIEPALPKVHGPPVLSTAALAEKLMEPEFDPPEKTIVPETCCAAAFVDPLTTNTTSGPSTKFVAGTFATP